MNFAEFQTERHAMIGKREALKEQRQTCNVTAKALLAHIRAGLPIDADICDLNIEELVIGAKAFKSTIEELRKIDSKLAILNRELDG